MTKDKFKNLVIDFVLAVCAGLSISIGGMVFVVSSSRVAGAIMFCVGLFMVLTLSFNLFTGKVCYALENKFEYLLSLVVIWLGNLVGCVGAGYALRLTRLVAYADACQNIVNTKLSDNLLSLFVLGVFCNILIFVAVDGFKKRRSPLGSYLSVFFGVTVFVLCGFEHCVADMFYISFANMWSGRAVVCLLFVTLGNCVGGLLIPSIFKLVQRLKKGFDNCEDVQNDIK